MPSRSFAVGAALFASALVAVIAAALETRARAQGPPTVPVAGAPGVVAAQTGGYIGKAECVSCHDAEGKSYEKRPHARAWNPRTPAAAQACESCHGPGARHIEDPAAPLSLAKFRKMAPRDVSERCLSCHNREAHAQWQGSQHDARNITCVNCHSMHASKSDAALLKATSVLQTCAQCHRDKAAKMLRSNHMPVREGKLDCTTCHNQHGSTNVRMLRAGNTINEACVSCHTEKRGPFLWEHAPVQENCTTCHDPHGSSNDRLLVAKPPALCQRCHIGASHPSIRFDATWYPNVSPVPPTGLTALPLSGLMSGRACVNCHSNIHGSNHPSGLFFQR